MSDMHPPATAQTIEPVPSPQRVLRRLFLTLFLRGRSARGLQREAAPKSVGQKLALTLFLYALFGCLALAFRQQSIFMLSVYLHALTFILLGMFVASSAGEVLFNKEEADILAHRPIGPKTLLWAKVRVLVEIGLWLAFALNLVGLFVGALAPAGSWRFPVVHVVSTALEALFAVGSVVLVYQLCLRWFGRERLDGIMTTAQVIVSVAAVLSGQILPRIAVQLNDLGKDGANNWWMAILPPAWFAGLDDALAGSGSTGAWLLAALSLIATAFVLWIAFGKLAGDYETGLQRLSETVSGSSRKRRGKGLVQRLANGPPLRWCLRNPVARSSFLLTAAYLIRDRDVKLRIYPAIAPMLLIPFIMLLQDYGRSEPLAGGFGIAFASSYVGLVPMLGLGFLQYSSQWQASDVFRAAPMPGPAPLFDGARWAVLCFLTLPLVAVFGLLAWLTRHDLVLLLPGLIAVPIYALVPNLDGKAVPLSVPFDNSKSAGLGLTMIAVTIVSMALSGIALWANSTGWFWWFIAAETAVAIFLYAVIRQSISAAKWKSCE